MANLLLLVYGALLKSALKLIKANLTKADIALRAQRRLQHAMKSYKREGYRVDDAWGIIVTMDDDDSMSSIECLDTEIRVSLRF